MRILYYYASLKSRIYFALDNRFLIDLIDAVVYNFTGEDMYAVEPPRENMAQGGSYIKAGRYTVRYFNFMPPDKARFARGKE